MDQREQGRRVGSALTYGGILTMVTACALFPHTGAAVEALPDDFWSSVVQVYTGTEALVVGFLRDLLALVW